jgi:hypothetical protein
MRVVREWKVYLVVLAALGGAGALAGLATPTARAAPGDYLGADACASRCHPGVLESWRKTGHAAATSALGARARDSACLSCHATGDGAATRSRLAGVQCEACHGGGAHYAPEDIMRDLPLARKLGLRDATTSCTRCHRGATTADPFDYTSAWKRIAH